MAQRLLEGAAFNMVKNLRYYQNRGKELDDDICQIEVLAGRIAETTQVDELMGVEGNIRQVYYGCFDRIVPGYAMGNRTKQPPNNELNALVSFGNMMCYTVCLDAIYHTQLNPTISFLHEPGARRYSLALDLAEVFKPLLVDRTIFRMLNKKELQPSDFVTELNRCTLKERGRKAFVQVFEDRLRETIQHRSLGRSVSYKYLVRLECYKLAKHLIGADEYKPFKMWW